MNTNSVLNNTFFISKAFESYNVEQIDSVFFDPTRLFKISLLVVGISIAGIIYNAKKPTNPLER